MTVEIEPPPAPDEREALLRALAELQEREADTQWWRAGVAEAVDGAPHDPSLD